MFSIPLVNARQLNFQNVWQMSFKIGWMPIHPEGLSDIYRQHHKHKFDDDGFFFSSKKRTFKVTGHIFHVNIIALVANHEISTNRKMLPGFSVIVNK